MGIFVYFIYLIAVKIDDKFEYIIFGGIDSIL